MIDTDTGGFGAATLALAFLTACQTHPGEVTPAQKQAAAMAAGAARIIGYQTLDAYAPAFSEALRASAVDCMRYSTISLRAKCLELEKEAAREAERESLER